MDKISKVVSVISVLFFNLLFFVQNVYADMPAPQYQNCDNAYYRSTHDCASSSSSELLFCIAAGVVVILVIAFSMTSIIKIRNKKNKK